MLRIGFLNHLFYERSHSAGPGELSIPFLLDEKPTVVPAASAGERSGGARKVLYGAAPSNSERAAPSACVGKRFSTRQVVWNRSNRCAGARGGARVDRPRWLDAKAAGARPAPETPERRERRLIRSGLLNTGPTSVPSSMMTKRLLIFAPAGRPGATRVLRQKPVSRYVKFVESFRYRLFYRAVTPRRRTMGHAFALARVSRPASASAGSTISSKRERRAPIFGARALPYRIGW